MLPLFDMLSLAQNGAGMEALARQFGLSQKQVQDAVEALLPAFSQGLKRSTADPYGIGALMSAMASGQHAKYFENPAAAFSPQGMAEGNDALAQLFGSKDLSRAVASQAAQATGIGQEILKQMLPVIASMIMGGLFKQSTGQMQAGAGSNPFAEMLGRMMQQGGLASGFGGGGAQASGTGGAGGFAGFPGFAGGQPGQQSPDPFDNPWGKAMRDMFGGAQTPQAGEQGAGAGHPWAENPWGRMFEQMMGGKAAPEPERTPSGRAKNPYDDLFGQMFETGRQQRKEYQKRVESIFDQFKQGMENGG